MRQNEQEAADFRAPTVLKKRVPRPWPVLIRQLVDEFVLLARKRDISRGGVRVYETDEKGRRVFLIVVRVPAAETRMAARPMERRPR